VARVTITCDCGREIAGRTLQIWKDGKNTLGFIERNALCRECAAPKLYVREEEKPLTQAELGHIDDIISGEAFKR